MTCPKEPASNVQYYKSPGTVICLAQAADLDLLMRIYTLLAVSSNTRQEQSTSAIKAQGCGVLLLQNSLAASEGGDAAGWVAPMHACHCVSVRAWDQQQSAKAVTNACSRRAELDSTPGFQLVSLRLP